MASTRLEAVIFDYGEVLSLPQAPEQRARMVDLSGLPGDRLWRDYRLMRPDYDRGLIDGAAYWSRVLAPGSAAVDPGLIAALVHEDGESWSRSNPAVLGWSRTLRAAGYKTAVLSNMPADMLRHIRRRNPWLEEFPVRIFSCRLGLNKPEPGIYRSCLEALGVSPAAALFLDDTPENVSAALALGMRAHRFSSFEETVPALSRRYGLPPAPGPPPG